jgi:hypothetical protein
MITISCGKPDRFAQILRQGFGAHFRPGGKAIDEKGTGAF